MIVLKASKQTSAGQTGEQGSGVQEAPQEALVRCAAEHQRTFSRWPCRIAALLTLLLCLAFTTDRAGCPHCWTAAPALSVYAN
jgi:hypothetical protein